ncbi:hypothetical protein [Mycobacterium sp.]|uniref:hypothetical protein n=1 Tax=Mycobacterium sp. TaxID=1785 RepID=UPI003F95B090
MSEPEFTIGGRTPEQIEQEAAARAAEQQRSAAAAAALSGDQTACDAAQSAYDVMRRVPQQQRNFNARAEALAEEHAKALGFADPDVINRFVAAEKAKFADTLDAQIPGACRQSAAERQAEADRKLDAVRAGLTPKSNDVAELMRQQAIWEAERKVLDSKENLGVAAAAAAKAIESATDIDELRVYARELPKYFEARDYEDTGFIDRALTAKVPEYAAAQQEQREELINKTITDHTAGYLERCAASGQPADPRILAKLDPSRIQSVRNMGRMG